MSAEISVVTVCRNALSALRRTAESVSGQDRSGVEWIVVDGASDDGTTDYLGGLPSGVVRWISEPDEGIYDAMNKGLSMATGDWIWFMNAGDCFFDADSVESVRGAMPGADIVYGDALVEGAGGEPLGLRSEVSPHRLPGKLDKRDFALGMPVSHQSFVVRRAIAPAFDAGRYRFSADVDWMLKILSVPRVARRTGPLSRIVREGATMQNWKRSQWERLRIMVLHFGLLPALSNHLSIALRRIAHGRRTRFWR